MIWVKIEKKCYDGLSNNNKFNFVVDGRSMKMDGFIVGFVFEKDKFIGSFEFESFEEAFHDFGDWI